MSVNLIYFVPLESSSQSLRKVLLDEQEGLLLYQKKFGANSGALHLALLNRFHFLSCMLLQAVVPTVESFWLVHAQGRESP